jgi:hypothetical protein
MARENFHEGSIRPRGYVGYNLTHPEKSFGQWQKAGESGAGAPFLLGKGGSIISRYHATVRATSRWRRELPGRAETHLAISGKARFRFWKSESRASDQNVRDLWAQLADRRRGNRDFLRSGRHFQCLANELHRERTISRSAGERNRERFAFPWRTLCANPANRILTATSEHFQAQDGRKAMQALDARDITAKFNPLGPFLRRWQFDDIHIQSGAVQIHIYKAVPEPSPSKPWFSAILTNRVYLKRIETETADVT